MTWVGVWMALDASPELFKRAGDSDNNNSGVTRDALMSFVSSNTLVSLVLSEVGESSIIISSSSSLVAGVVCCSTSSVLKNSDLCTLSLTKKE